MTLTPKHAQFFVNAELEDHLADNGETLIELLTAIGDPKAMSALSRLLSSNVCCAKCHARDLQIVIECLCGVFETSAATRLILMQLCAGTERGCRICKLFSRAK